MGTSIVVQCEGEAYIDDFDTEDLVRELKKRKQPIDDKREREELHEVREAIASRRYDDALVYIDRVLWPKWKSEERCAADLAEITNRTRQ